MEFRLVRETTRVPAVPWRRLFNRVTRGERSRPATSIALVLTTPRRSATLNRQYHHGNGPTDVLAFPAAARPRHDASGDIVLCPSVLRQRFPAVPVSALLAHRFVHALLHLHGYQHHSVRAAARMEIRTRHYLALVHPAWLQSLPIA